MLLCEVNYLCDTLNSAHHLLTIKIQTSLKARNDTHLKFAFHVSDIDECLTAANNCRYACKNLIGSFMCICPQGYVQVGTGDQCRGK